MLQLSQFNPYSDFIMIRSTTRKHDGKVQYTSLCLSANYIIEEIDMPEVEKTRLGLQCQTPALSKV